MSTAIVVFVLRELFELMRRRAATGRQIEAYKIILRRECELNAWAVTRLRETLEAMKSNPGHFKVFKTEFDLRFEFESEGGRNSWPIPSVYLDDIKGSMLAVAALQSDIFERLERCYEACLDLVNLRQHTVEYLFGQADGYDVEALHDYGSRELKDIHTALDRLYRACTNGEELGAGIPY
ncbi:hypothetical protein [Bradyrhizobium sp. Cp5.3]|uniref:hypothetical protein n=1 Tax=Bradyrhizobium sp. Cp5.3 TaxID=443598 RepID=UPI0012EC4854|nr:hypothetical protein [Bradyrhizobium sp. Cp5.3]